MAPPFEPCPPQLCSTSGYTVVPKSFWYFVVLWVLNFFGGVHGVANTCNSGRILLAHLIGFPYSPQLFSFGLIRTRMMFKPTSPAPVPHNLFTFAWV